MARQKKLEISALNIKLQPHSPELYVELFQDAFNLQQVAKMWADYYGILSSRYFINSDNPLDGFTGSISRFLHIDTTKPWFNMKQNKEAEPEDISEVNIPPHLKPNMANFRYAFFPVGHRLFFETYSERQSIGAKAVTSFFNRIFGHETIVKKYGEVTIILEPSKEILEEIMSIHTLTHLDMSISKPNPDDPFEGFERQFYEKMDRENATNHETSLAGPALTPSEETQMLARVAASNGFVKGSGKNADGETVKKSTKERPLQKRFYYNPDTENLRDVFLYSAGEMLEDMRIKK